MRLGLAVLMALFSANLALAEDRRVFLETGDGTRIEVATLRLTPEKGYAIEMAEAPFVDHFLSMRPFKCLEGPAKHWCHVPYPYEIKRNIGTDLTDLEYDFLFIWKDSTEYGINMWNGIYYKLEKASDGSLEGRVHELDMDLLSAPPPEGELRPVRPGDLYEADPESHWLPRMVIE